MTQPAKQPSDSLEVLGARARDHYERAEAAFGSAVEEAILCGEALADAKAQAAHGEWLPWVECNFPAGLRTAQRYMKVAANATRVSHFTSLRDAIAELAEPRDEPKLTLVEPAEPPLQGLQDVVREGEFRHTLEPAPTPVAELPEDDEPRQPTEQETALLASVFEKYGFDDALQAAIDMGVELPEFTVVVEPPVIDADKMAVHYSSSTDEWATPQDFFDVVNAEFGFDLDACALPSSAKCERYFAPEDDGLAQEWKGVVWMNPPYGSEIVDWVKKAYDSSRAGATVVCLVPARTDTNWFHDYCFPGEVRFIKGRLRFGDADASAPFPSALVVLEPKGKASAYGWDWK